MRRFVYFFVVLSCVNMVVTVPVMARDKINIFVSILPQKFLVEQIGGDRVQVSVMVRPGSNPETYEPTPRQMAALHQANLYFRMAVPFEAVWIDKISSLNPDLKIVDCCGTLPVTDPGEHEYDMETGVSANDAHVWTSPGNAIVLAGIIQSALSEFDPESREYYVANYNTLVKELEQLDQSIRDKLAHITNRYFIVAHPSWGHFAKAYDLTQIPIERHGTEIQARELSRLVEFSRMENIHTVYVQKQFNSAPARVLAREINGRIVELDPLAEDYIANLRSVAKAIVAGAGQL